MGRSTAETATKDRILAAAVRDTSLDRNQRAKSLMVLAAKGGTQALEVCLSALDDGDELVRGTAATALADLGDPRAVERLRIAAAAPENARLARIIQGSIRRLESAPR